VYEFLFGDQKHSCI